MTTDAGLSSWPVPDDALSAVRQAAFARAEQSGLPHRRTPGWRHTNVGRIAKTAFVPTSAPGELPIDALGSGFPPGPRLVFVDGVLSAAHSSLPDELEGVHIATLSATLETGPEAIADIIARHPDTPGGAFTDLNTALAREGAVVIVDEGAVIEHPIHLVFATTRTTESSAHHLRNVLYAGRGSHVTLVEHFLGFEGEATLTNIVTDIVTADSASVGHARVQREASTTFHVADVRVHQERDSLYTSWSFAFGAALSRTSIHVALDGTGAGCGLFGLYLGGGQQVVDHTTVVSHASPHCVSNELYKGILDDTAHGVFSGLVKVAEGANGTNATQNNRNLLLSESAHIDSEPQLEILTDDVQCSHGSAVGRLDEDALFYLRARGIGLPQARKLLTMAFAREILDTVTHPELRASLETVVDHWLETR